ncbi:MAG: FtsX-like permease family protein [Bacteroidetes bacterium]|nr:FtsX-like permease family protein [Bacteroidota bacterium]
MNIFHLSWKNILNKPLTLVLNLVLFSLGVGLISLLLLVNVQLEEKFQKNFAGVDLVIGAKGSPLQLILSSLYHLDSPTGNMPISESKAFLNPKHPVFKKAVPLSLGDSHRGYRIVGTDKSFVDLYEAKLREGRMFEEIMEVVAGATVAKNLNLKIGNQFQSSHGLIEDENLVHKEAKPFIVKGILEKTGAVIDQLILTKTQSVWAVHEEHDHESEMEEDHAEHDHAEHDHAEHDHAEHDHAEEEKPLTEYEDQSITSLLVQFKGRNIQALNMARNINENTNFQAATPAIEINRLYTLLGVGEEALKALAMLIIFVSGLSIFISLFSSLRERKYELAVMRTLGARPGFLFQLIIFEGLFIAVLGFLCGIALSHGSMIFLADFLEKSYRYDFSAALFLKEEIYLFGGSLIIGIIAAIIPALQASNTDIHATLAENKG